MESTRRKFLSFLLATPLAGLLPKKAAAQPEPQKVLINKFTVAGFQYYKGPKLIGYVKPGDMLSLAEEPENLHDEFAVQILYQGKHIGYVPRSDNRHISRLLQEKVRLECMVTEADRKASPWEMLKVEVFLVS